MECAPRKYTRALGAGECSLTTALATLPSRWIAVRSSWLTTGGSRENFQFKQMSPAEMPGVFFRLISVAISLRKRDAEELKVISKSQPGAGPKRSQRSTC